MDIIEELRKNRENILNLFENKFIGTNGLPVLSVDALTGKFIDETSLISELGDYLPFLAYFGQNEFADSQLKLVEDHFDTEKFIWTKHPRLPDHSWAFEYTDLLLGLIICYEIYKNDRYLVAAEKVIDFVLEAFYNQGFISTHYFKILKYSPPITSSLCLMFVELFVDMYLFTKKEKYLSLAEKIMNNMIHSDGFTNYGLFPSYYPIYQPIRMLMASFNITKRYDATKYNVTASQSLVALYAATKKDKYVNAYMKWFDGVNKYLKYLEGGYAKRVIMNNKKPKLGLDLKNFHFIETFADMYYFSKEETLLKSAEDLAHFWLKTQGKTGLLPFDYNDKKSRLDPGLDFCVGLCKLFELTNKGIYREKTEQIITSILKYHTAPFGLVESVDINTGELLDPIISIKFLSLFLKIDILCENNFHSYNNRLLYSILRDR